MKRLPRSWAIVVAALTSSLALLLITSYPVMHVYVRHWFGSPPAIGIDFRAISPGWTERDVIAQFKGAVIACDNEVRLGGDNLGERACWTSLSSFDDAPALTLAMFFHRGKLVQAVVHVPWWAHHRVARQLVRRLGPPDAMGDRGDRLAEWQLANGSVFFNRDPGWNPMRWGAVMWKAK